MRDRPSDQHRKLTEHELGRKLTPNEVVHHKDENKANNTKENREVQTRSDHTRAHNKTRALSKLRKALTAHVRGEKVY